jgi:hypothetical protein
MTWYNRWNIFLGRDISIAMGWHGRSLFSEFGSLSFRCEARVVSGNWRLLSISSTGQKHRLVRRRSKRGTLL